MLHPLPLPKGRLEALTDGIFAVSMTLLVLDLKFPEGSLDSPDGIWQTLLKLQDQFDDYVISFVVLCVFWLGHNRLMQRAREIDATFMWLNLMFLLFTTFVPPLTIFVGHNPNHPRAAILYGVNLALITLFELLLWRRCLLHLANESVLDARNAWRTVRRRYLIAICVVLLGIAAALIEIDIGRTSGLGHYIYLLLIAAGIMRPMPRHHAISSAGAPGSL